MTTTIKRRIERGRKLIKSFKFNNKIYILPLSVRDLREECEVQLIAF